MGAYGNMKQDPMVDEANKGAAASGGEDEGAEEANDGLFEDHPQGAEHGFTMPNVDTERGRMLGDTYGVDLSGDAVNRIIGIGHVTKSDDMHERHPQGDRRDVVGGGTTYKGGA